MDACPGRLILSFVLAAAGAISAESQSDESIEISLRQAVLLTLRNNLDIRIASLAPDIADDSVLQQVSTFDSVLTSSVAGGKAEQQTGTQLAGAEVISTDRFDAAIGIRKRYEAGTVVSTDLTTRREGSNSFFSSFDSSNAANAAVTVSQPLLKGRGTEVNLAAIQVARNTRQQSLHEFRRTVEIVVGQTEKAYWNLVFAQANLRVQQALLDQAKSLLEHVNDLKAGGILTATDVIQARAGVASREENIIVADQALRNAEDVLKEITSMLSDDSKRDSAPTATTIAKISQLEVREESALQNAFKNRPEYQAARLDLQSRNLAVVVARNARYPKLDLQGTFALNGLTGSYGNTVDSLVSTDFYEWNVGLTLELPRGFRSARSTYRRRQNEKAQTLLRMKQLEQQILREVRLSTRQVRATQKRIQTTEAARDLQKEKLAGEEDRLKDGQSTPQEVLDFQVDFAVAELNNERSKLDYQKAIVDLEVAQGTLLETRLIEIVDNQILGSE